MPAQSVHPITFLEAQYRRKLGIRKTDIVVSWELVAVILARLDAVHNKFVHELAKPDALVLLLARSMPAHEDAVEIRSEARHDLGLVVNTMLDTQFASNGLDSS